MTTDQLKKKVKKWANQLGPDLAMQRLVMRSVGVSAAEKLIRGRYPSEPRPKLLEVLKEELARDGFFID